MAPTISAVVAGALLLAVRTVPAVQTPGKACPATATLDSICTTTYARGVFPDNHGLPDITIDASSVDNARSQCVCKLGIVPCGDH